MPLFLLPGLCDQRSCSACVVLAKALPGSGTFWVRPSLLAHPCARSFFPCSPVCVLIKSSALSPPRSSSRTACLVRKCGFPAGCHVVPVRVLCTCILAVGLPPVSSFSFVALPVSLFTFYCFLAPLLEIDANRCVAGTQPRPLTIQASAPLCLARRTGVHGL